MAYNCIPAFVHCLKAPAVNVKGGMHLQQPMLQAEAAWSWRLCLLTALLMRLVWGMQATPRVNLPADKIKALTLRIQDAGTEVVKAKVTMQLSSPSCWLPVHKQP